MVHSGLPRWRSNPIILLILIAVFCITSIIVLYNRSSSNLENFDIDLLSAFCNQQLLTGDVNNNRKSLFESDQVSHLYGEQDEYKSSVKGQTMINDRIWKGLKVKGAIYMLIQENDLNSARATIRSIEDRFHSNLNTSYPYIILSKQLLKPELKTYLRKATKYPERVFFGQIDLEAWSYPYWVDSNRAENAYQHMKLYSIKGGSSPYYHHAQRYQSGLFVHHPLFDNVEYVWQVEAGSTYSCDMFHDDPFIEMKLKNKKIGFSLTNKEQKIAMHSLWPATFHYMQKNPHLIQPSENSIAPWLLDSKAEFNYCQMSSSFQVLDISFIRSDKFQQFFHYLDLVGGYFYERWTDAATRTVAAALFLEKRDILYLDSIGFTSKNNAEHCPLNEKGIKSCTCNFKNSHVLRKGSCTIDLVQHLSLAKLEEMFNFLGVMLDKEEKQE